MLEIIGYLLLVLLLAAGAIAAVAMFRAYRSGTSPLGAFFGAKPDARLNVVEQANVDGRRRLILVRRDDVEHLIMTGGPVDVVIETGIRTVVVPQHVAQHPSLAVATHEPVFTRPARTLGQPGPTGH